jgi:hypothetical protein
MQGRAPGKKGENMRDRMIQTQNLRTQTSGGAADSAKSPERCLAGQ